MKMTRSPYYNVGDPDSGIRRGLINYPFVMWQGRPWVFEDGWMPCNGWVDFYKGRPW